MTYMSVGIDHRHKIVSVIVETLLQVKEKTLRQAKGSESNVCIRVGPDGAAIMIWFRNSSTGPSCMTDFGTTRGTSRRSTNHLSEWPEGPWGGEPRPSPQFMM